MGMEGAAHMMGQRTFITRTRALLADNAGVRKRAHCLTGKYLDEPRLGLVPAGERRVFARPERRQYHDYHIALLMDVSGSMSGSKLRHAASAIHALWYALRVAGAAVSVFGFTCVTEQWNERIVSDPTVLHNAAQRLMNRYSGNHDGEAIRHVARHLMENTRAPGKILLVLSDGQPSCGECKLVVPGVTDEQDLRNAVREIRRAGQVTLLGVGILTSAPHMYYGKRHTALILRSEDMPTLYHQTAALLHQHIQRG